MVNIYDLTKKQKEYYKSIISVFCPLLNDTVYFTNDGFNHLLYDTNRKPRNIAEQFLKLSCLDYASLVLQNSKALISTRTYTVNVRGKIKTIIHYALVHEIKRDKKFRVIVERFGTGKYRFLSVMPHNKKANTI